MSKVINAMFLVGALFSSLVWADNQEGARDTVVKVVNEFRTQIVADKAELKNNPALLSKKVDKILTPVVNFDDFAKKVMGKYYRRATPEQRIRFATVTKETLLKTYGGSLLDLDPNKIKVLPLGPQNRSDEVRVDVTFQRETGKLIDINFFMEDYGNNNWKLSNVVVSNINFGLTFRKQFGVMMQQNRNNIDDAITAWKDSLSKKQS
ncbi:putative phospholipid-binding protein MlaC precursor [Marinomonas spartinae]|uniref:Putative phospholipid-binding protein MlaC n=1 Tax=Marinomonas spartinae TaxID=1792290 RepID=A0A1A8TBE3_9GAMM|nr:ABC transporter substrate-binding protein [Marinomonas spartinae]SBS29968.1 putative phospholipid-binding protein MlaC precursor [Marinomonas spartinae]SBS37097.1 putative phospholipid-binding protein MlaC precursor [Marinomonas spartinae]